MNQQLRPGTRRRLVRWLRLGAAALVLGIVVLRLGADPFVDGVRRVDATSLAAVGCITAVTTVVSAWRWQLIARGLGLHIPLGSAVASYYRSQFLNSTLPGGVVGDLHRGVRHGAATNDVSRGVRSVVWDRAAGQTVQVVLATFMLLVIDTPVRSAVAAILGMSLTVAAVIALTVRALPRGAISRLSRLFRTLRSDLRSGLLTAQVWPVVVVASTVVVAGHVAVFLVAAGGDGSSGSVRQLVPLAMLVLLAMSLPISIGGWGPREGVAAWAFALAGLGAERGVAAATTYGILSLVATLPGAVVLVLSGRPRSARRTQEVSADPVQQPTG